MNKIKIKIILIFLIGILLILLNSCKERKNQKNIGMNFKKKETSIEKQINEENTLKKEKITQDINNNKNETNKIENENEKNKNNKYEEDNDNKGKIQIPKGITDEQYEVGKNIPDKNGIYLLDEKYVKSKIIPYKKGLYWYEGIGIENGIPKYLNMIDQEDLSYLIGFYKEFYLPKEDWSEFYKNNLNIYSFDIYYSGVLAFILKMDYDYVMKKFIKKENIPGLFIEFYRDKDNEKYLVIYSFANTNLLKEVFFSGNYYYNGKENYIRENLINRYYLNETLRNAKIKDYKVKSLYLKYINNDIYLSEDKKGWEKLEISNIKRLFERHYIRKPRFIDCDVVWKLHLKSKWFEGDYFIQIDYYE